MQINLWKWLKPYLVFANHRDLLHGMKNVPERDIGVFSVNFIRTLDAEVERRRAIRCIRDANVVIIANFDGFCVARIRTRVALTGKGDQIVCGRSGDDFNVENVPIDSTLSVFTTHL